MGLTSAAKKLKQKIKEREFDVNSSLPPVLYLESVERRNKKLRKELENVFGINVDQYSEEHLENIFEAALISVLDVDLQYIVDNYIMIFKRV